MNIVETKKLKSNLSILLEQGVNKYFIFICLMLVVSLIYSQTKTETVDWLNTETRKLYAVDDASKTCVNDNEFFNNGTFKITHYFSSRELFSKPVIAFELTGNLKNFYQRTEVVSGKDYRTNKLFWYVMIKGYNSNCINQKYIPNDIVSLGSISYDDKQLSIGPMLDEETAKRVSKAVSHLITLCGGKKEPF